VLRANVPHTTKTTQKDKTLIIILKTQKMTKSTTIKTIRCVTFNQTIQNCKRENLLSKPDINYAYSKNLNHTINVKYKLGTKSKNQIQPVKNKIARFYKQDLKNQKVHDEQKSIPSNSI